MPTSSPCLVWFRNDLRVADHPALAAAAHSGRPVIALYVHSPLEDGRWGPGAAARVWLHDSLYALDARLRELGSRLIIRAGPELDALRAIAAETGARTVLWNRRYEPPALARDKATMAALRSDGMEVTSYPGSLLFEPWEITTQAGRPVQVFTPFWRALRARPEPLEPIAAPRALAALDERIASLGVDALGLRPRIGWDAGIRGAWRAGSDAAHARLRSFVATGRAGYAESRDVPSRPGTSRLSPHLHFGEISPREIWHAVKRVAERDPDDEWRDSRFLKEIGWREFAHHLLFHFPHTPDRPLRTEFERFPWRADASRLAAWHRGETGYPLVDAGMRELWATGWMHNRVRMVAASFLVKHLLQSWTEGAAWFWDTLVDADLANNTLGWQWTAGCGADAAPYFRVFNPVLQGEKFDMDGTYVRRWLPELERLPARWIHRPFDAPEEELGRAGVRLGVDYPRPVVDHATARAEALAAFARISRAADSAGA